jgi:hypothetical protein
MRSLRTGEPVADVRDAAVAVDLAREFQRKRESNALFRWLIRPRRGIGGVVHAVHVPVLIALALVPIAIGSHGVLRWLLVGAICYFAVFWLFVWPWIVKPFDNAAAAEEQNRKLLS